MKAWQRACGTVAIGMMGLGVMHGQTEKPDDNSGIVQTTGEPDQPVLAQAERLKKDQPAALAEAWEMLKSAGEASKPLEHVGLLVALGTMGGYKDAESILVDSMKSGDLDVRLAAVAAAGGSEDKTLIPALKQALDDKTPEVMMTAAAALWKLDDHSGEEVLQGVLSGQVKGKSGAFKSGLHTMSHDMHDPSAMWMMGAEEGAGMLFGPVGMAIGAVRFAHPGPSANSPRVISAGLLASNPIEANEKILIATAKDKDPFVRQASLRALGKFHGSAVTDALIDGFDDPKPSVRYMAAASYIRVVTPLKGAARTHVTHRAVKHS
ncbi:HEAT repeat domain-containing protein [Silvibacterium dinghuense]|uniref:HEAT repeat domain-containing protein n=1 Tax=Silvibacterium dinghuense TaxID=1560006 RepID=A0A4Q1SBQ8_9BACT|nr:HEAT repeat domain-containing protein [Silvibacterium dinghuense]RXS94571.1 HEAT repeat domain-containing protein [Silvibacterium dinghuense]GGH15273.1 hypothetical protein GCM10011586_36250 [Silvibacterium dinghuense]